MCGYSLQQLREMRFLYRILQDIAWRKFASDYGNRKDCQSWLLQTHAYLPVFHKIGKTHFFAMRLVIPRNQAPHIFIVKHQFQC